MSTVKSLYQSRSTASRRPVVDHLLRPLSYGDHSPGVISNHVLVLDTRSIVGFLGTLVLNDHSLNLVDHGDPVDLHRLHHHLDRGRHSGTAFWTASI